MTLLGQATWVAAPVILAGLAHVAVIKTGSFPRLAGIPLDGGLVLRGRRILGDNKTLRGALTMIAATTLLVLVQAGLTRRFAWARAAWPFDFAAVSPLAWGACLGAGYVAGELPNSFLKRRLAVGPGAAARGRLRPWFWLADQIDSCLGVLAFMCLLWRPPLGFALLLVAVTLVVHPLVAWLMRGLRLKDRVG